MLPDRFKRFMGFDFGLRRIGVAFASLPGNGAQGIATVRNGPNGLDWDALDRLIADWEPHALVIGLPVNMDGNPGPMTPRARRFGYRLAGRYHMQPYFVDERLSSFAAEEELRESGLPASKRAKLLDQTAARMILDSFLVEQAGKGGADEG